MDSSFVIILLKKIEVGKFVVFKRERVKHTPPLKMRLPSGSAQDFSHEVMKVGPTGGTHLGKKGRR